MRKRPRKETTTKAAKPKRRRLDFFDSEASMERDNDAVNDDDEALQYYENKEDEYDEDFIDDREVEQDVVYNIPIATNVSDKSVENCKLQKLIDQQRAQLEKLEKQLNSFKTKNQLDVTEFNTNNRYDMNLNIHNERRDPEKLNWNFIRVHVHNLGNYGVGEDDILGCLSKSKNTSYRAFLLFFSTSNQNLCKESEDINLMKDIFESKGETGFCKSTLEPCNTERYCNYSYDGGEDCDVDENGVCESSNGFGIIYLRGTHKYDTF